MSGNTAIYQIGRMGRAVTATTSYVLACGSCDAKAQGVEEGGVLAVTVARELYAKGWTFIDGDKAAKCPVCAPPGDDPYRNIPRDSLKPEPERDDTHDDANT